MEEKSQGILLDAIPYLGRQKILKIFTAEVGMISLIIKGAKSVSFASPFCAAEWVYRKSEREIFPLIDGTLLDPFSNLRLSYEIISAAGSIAKDLLRSQMPLRASPSLYQLLMAFFKRLGISQNPEALAISFRLKLLLHEGLLSFSSCRDCGKEASSLMQGESYCPLHGAEGLSFSSLEWKNLILLSFGRQFAQIESAEISKNLLEKTLNLFEERTR